MEKKIKKFTCDFITINFSSRQESLLFLEEYQKFSNQKLTINYTENFHSKFYHGHKEKLIQNYELPKMDVFVNYCKQPNFSHHQLIFPGLPARNVIYFFETTKTKHNHEYGIKSISRIDFRLCDSLLPPKLKQGEGDPSPRFGNTYSSLTICRPETDIQRFKTGLENVVLSFDNVDYRINPDSLSFIGGRKLK